MSGYKKRRARNQRYRAMRKAWNSGYRPILGQHATSARFYDSVFKIILGAEQVHIEGIDQNGDEVEEDVVLMPIYAKSFDEWLEYRRMKNKWRGYIKKIVLPRL